MIKQKTSQETFRVLNSQQTRVSVIYMHRLSTICLLDHYNNGFMATDALGQTLARFHVAGIQEFKDYSM